MALNYGRIIYVIRRLPDWKKRNSLECILLLVSIFGKSRELGLIRPVTAKPSLASLTASLYIVNIIENIIMVLNKLILIFEIRNWSNRFCRENFMPFSFVRIQNFQNRILQCLLIEHARYCLRIEHIPRSAIWEQKHAYVRIQWHMLLLIVPFVLWIERQSPLYDIIANGDVLKRKEQTIEE